MYAFLYLGFARTVRMVILSALGDVGSTSKETRAGSRCSLAYAERDTAIASK